MNLLTEIERFDSNLCFIDENNKALTYKNIVNTCDVLSKDLKPQNLVLVLAHNHIEFFTSYISFFRKGLAQMLVDSKISARTLEDIIETFKPCYVLLPSSRIVEIKNYEILNKLNEHLIVKLNKENFHPINKNLCLLLSTSGSTGSKKFVRITYENIYENTKNIIKFLGINQDHRTITTMPPFYTYGLSIVNTHLFVGASIVVTNLKAVEKNFWNLMCEQKIISFGGVPYFYEILKKIKFNQMILPNLKYFTQAGGALKKDLLKYFLEYCEKRNKQFIIMYGQTEATARMTYLPYELAKKKKGSIGIPISGGKIVLKNDRHLSDNEGEIIYMGKNVSMGYAKNLNDLNKGDENKGVLATGDLAKKDKDGFLYIIGRKSRDIKLFGHRVNMDDLENILTKKGYNCICHGVDNRVTVFYNNKNYNDNVLNYLSKETKLHVNCFKLKFLKKFPIGENGKIFYKKLEKLL